MRVRVCEVAKLAVVVVAVCKHFHLAAFSAFTGSYVINLHLTKFT